MEALDLLEKRIDSLTRMLGPLPEQLAAATDADETPTGNTPTAKESICDSLISAHTLLTSAIGEREQIQKTIERAPELEKYLDPNFLEETQEVRSKEIYLAAVAPDLHAQFEQLDEIKQLEPTLGAEYFRNIPGECTDKLKQYVADNAEFAQQSELIEESLILAMKRYGELQAGLLGSLDGMNKRLEAVEEKLQRKKREALEKELPVKE